MNVCSNAQSRPRESVSGLELGEECVDVNVLWLGLANLPVGVVDELLVECFRHDQVDLLQLDAGVRLPE